MQNKLCVICEQPLRHGCLYCSYTCRSKDDIYRQKIKLSLGKYYATHSSHFKGVKLIDTHSNEGMKKIKNSQFKPGKDHWNWKGGIAKNMQYNLERGSEWDVMRHLAYKRDNYTCQECGNIKTRLIAHHIDQNPKNNILSNLITLCGSCHTKLHRRCNT